MARSANAPPKATLAVVLDVGFGKSMSGLPSLVCKAASNIWPGFFSGKDPPSHAPPTESLLALLEPPLAKSVGLENSTFSKVLMISWAVYLSSTDLGCWRRWLYVCALFVYLLNVFGVLPAKKSRLTL